MVDDEHHGPTDKLRARQNYSIPDNNHYGQRNVLDALVSIATEYHSLFPSDSLIAINDISLPNGGRFDVFGNWHKPHIFHRFGLDVDVGVIQFQLEIPIWMKIEMVNLI